MSGHMSRRESLAERAVCAEIIISADKTVDTRVGGYNALSAGIAVELERCHSNGEVERKQLEPDLELL